MLRHQQHTAGSKLPRLTVELQACGALLQPQQLKQTVMPTWLNLPIVQAAAGRNRLTMHQIWRQPLLLFAI